MKAALLDRCRTLFRESGVELIPSHPDAPYAESMIDVVDPTSALRLVFSVADGPLMVASTLLKTPPVSEDDLDTGAARLQLHVPRARVHMRIGPGGASLAMLDAAHAVNPDEPVLDMAAVQGLLDALTYAARCIGLLEPGAHGDAQLLGYSAADGQAHEVVRRVLLENGIDDPHEESDVLGGSCFMVSAGDGPLTRILVREQTLLFQTYIPTDDSVARLASVAGQVHRRLPFGRVLLTAAGDGMLVLEYPHRLAAAVSEFDVLHGLGAVTALHSVCVSALASNET